MNTTKRRKPIEWVFALVSVVIVWQLQLPSLLSDFAGNLGISQGSWLHRIIVDGGVPITLVLISWIAVWFYKNVIWPWWPNSRCQEGWWIYALFARDEQKSIDVVGCFLLKHDVEHAIINEGHAFYADKPLKYRGRWSSNTIVITDHEIKLIFSMRAVKPTIAPLPSHYDGYIESRFTHYKPLIGRTAWHGYFHDLGDRHHITGPIYAERLPRRIRHQTTDEIQKLLESEAEKLVSKVHEKVS